MLAAGKAATKCMAVICFCMQPINWHAYMPHCRVMQTQRKTLKLVVNYAQQATTSSVIFTRDSM